MWTISCYSTLTQSTLTMTWKHETKITDIWSQTHPSVWVLVRMVLLSKFTILLLYHSLLMSTQWIEEEWVTGVRGDKCEGWQVWEATSVRGDKCEMTNVRSDKCEWWQVWGVTNVRGDKCEGWQCEGWQVWGVTSVRCDKCEEWQVWGVTSVRGDSMRGDKCEEYQVWGVTV